MKNALYKEINRLDAENKRLQEAALPCIWQEDDDGNWHTGCGEIFVLIAGTPEENKMKFCPYCGKPLKEETP